MVEKVKSEISALITVDGVTPSDSDTYVAPANFIVCCSPGREN